MKKKQNNLGKIIAVLVAIVLLLGTIYAVYYLLNRGKTAMRDYSNTTSETQPVETTASHRVKDTVLPKLENDDKSDDGYLDGAVYIWQNKGFEIFKGTIDNAKSYAESINNYKKMLGDNYKVYNMVIPTAAEITLPERLSKKVSNLQRENINAIISALSEKVTPIDVYGAIGEHRNDETPLYYNTDKYYTQYGAYYAYTELTKTLDVKPVDIHTMSAVTSEYTFLGSHITATVSKETKNGNPMLLSNPDTLTYYLLPDTATVTALPQGSQTAYDMPYYSTELSDGSSPMSIYATRECAYTVIRNSNVNSGKIAVVCDKFGYAIMPFLCCNYNEVHLIDIDNFERNLKHYLEENKISNILYLNGIMSANSVSKTAKTDAMF